MINESELLAGLLLIAALSLAIPPPAYGHAFPSGAQPAVGSTVTSSPSEVVITFDNPIETLFASLEVRDSSGQSLDAGQPAVSDDHRQLSVKLKTLAPGEYTVKWSVVAQDGHQTEGAFNFTVAGS